MIQRIELLNDWYFQPEYSAGMEQSREVTGFSKVQLPHTNVELPYHYFDEKVSQIISCYKYFFAAPQLAADQVVFLQFEGVMAYAKVFLNGQFLGEHKGGYTPFSFPVQKIISAS